MQEHAAGGAGAAASLHDLRGPLAVASGRVQLARAELRRDDADPVLVDADLATAEMALDRMLAAIERVEEAERILDRIGGDADAVAARFEPDTLDGAGALVRATAVSRTVAALRLAETAAVAARAAAEDVARAKGALLAATSHELRTPLTAIVGYAGLLEASLGAAGRPHDARDAAQIARSAQHLSALVDDIVDTARIEAGALRLQPKEVDLANLVGQVVAQLAPLADANGIGLTAEAPEGLLVEADPTRLRQILLNLVGNAVKFTERGSVNVTARSSAAGVVVTVTDTGIGIAPEALSFVFEEFRQADQTTTRRHGGFGLGLSITKKLVELHRGTIVAESTPGSGSTFTVTLPAA